MAFPRSAPRPRLYQYWRHRLRILAVHRPARRDLSDFMNTGPRSLNGERGPVALEADVDLGAHKGPAADMHRIDADQLETVCFREITVKRPTA